MTLKLKTDPVIRITAVVILLSCLCLCGEEADAFRQVHPSATNPNMGPPPQSVQNPSLFKWSSQEVLSVFKENGLEVVNIQKGLTMGHSTARETVIFLIPSSGENIGGLVSSYSSLKALEEDMKYYSGMNNPDAPPAWRIFRRKNILLLISGKVPEKKAMGYKKALEGM
jgi:hypothetical protein